MRGPLGPPQGDVVVDETVAYTVLEPHFDAVRDFFAEFEVAPGHRLEKVRRTKLVVDGSARNSKRHYAACRDDGLLIVLAPQAVTLPLDNVVAIIAHEFGHAVDFLYPGRWMAERDNSAVWLPEDTPKMGRLRRIWNERNDDQVEWSADSIAYAVTGKKIGYCGPCMLQCFSGGAERPEGLR